MTNELLLEKSRTQKRLDDIAHHSLVKYVENAHANVQQSSIQLGLTLNYGKPTGGFKQKTNLPVAVQGR